MSRLINLIYKRFGKLVVIQRMDNDKYGHIKYLCKCDCKQKKIVRIDSLKSGKTKSCGCLHKEKIIVLCKKRTVHGHTTGRKESITYKSWLSMKQRCADFNNNQYKNYGGRGITVCKRWINSFGNFLEDMKERPTKNHSIDRIDNNSGYYKENCRWATPKEQARNTRRNCLIVFNGKIQCLTDWAKETNINTTTLWARIFQYNWSIKKALTTSIRRETRNATR